MFFEMPAPLLCRKAKADEGMAERSVEVVAPFKNERLCIESTPVSVLK
jgi:hypothetical protein